MGESIDELDKSESSNEHPIYPELRSDYTFVTGLLGEFCANVALEDLGYEVNFNHSPNANGVDIKINDIGIEVWNHVQPHMYYDRVESTKNNLEEFKYKYVITSFIAEPIKNELESDDINVIVTGFQILVNSKPYLDFYKKDKGKKYFNKRTAKYMKNLLRSKLPKQQTETNTEPSSAYVYSNNSSIDNIISSWFFRVITSIYM